MQIFFDFQQAVLKKFSWFLLENSLGRFWIPRIQILPCKAYSKNIWIGFEGNTSSNLKYLNFRFLVCLRNLGTIGLTPVIFICRPQKLS